MEAAVRTFQVSDGTFAAVWSKWQEGDTNEDEILRRILGVAKTPSAIARVNGLGDTIGYRDQRYGVDFPKGFEIFRTFKGQDRRAKAQNGGWASDDNRFFRSLNQLSAHIGAPTENAWMGWSYRDGNRVRPISDLRDPSKIQHRS
jgi:hypothetical protein